MRTTIKDVARAAGVATSTVTRVIQDSNSISQSTKEIVRKVMQDLNYHPNFTAQSLVNKRTRIIGLVLPNDSDTFYQNPFFPQAVRGISQVATEKGYAIQLSTGVDDEQRLETVSQMVDGLRVDGLIFLYSQENDPIVAYVQNRKFPFVILGKTASPFVSLVDNDNIRAAYEATVYFLKKGYQNVAFVGGNKELVVSQDRFEGYKKALEEYDMVPDENKIRFTSGFLLEDSSYRIMKKLGSENIEAIVTTDIIVAEGVLNFLREKKMNIPIISFDSVKPKIDIAAYVDINAIELARQSCATLLQIIEDKQDNKDVSYRKLIPHSIIEL